MNKLLVFIEIAAVMTAGAFGLLWARDPSGPYEPITFLALLVGVSVVEIVRRFLRSRQDESKYSRQIDELKQHVSEQIGRAVEEADGFVAINGSNYSGGTKTIKKFPYDPRIKVWELLEIIEEYLPDAVASEYEKTWLLKNTHSGVTIMGLGAFVREKGYLEEEARTLQHIGIGPNTTLEVVKGGR